MLNYINHKLDETNVTQRTQRLKQVYTLEEYDDEQKDGDWGLFNSVPNVVKQHHVDISSGLCEGKYKEKGLTADFIFMLFLMET